MAPTPSVTCQEHSSLRRSRPCPHRPPRSTKPAVAGRPAIIPARSGCAGRRWKPTAALAGNPISRRVCFLLGDATGRCPGTPRRGCACPASGSQLATQLRRWPLSTRRPPGTARPGSAGSRQLPRGGSLSAPARRGADQPGRVVSSGGSVAGGDRYLAPGCAGTADVCQGASQFRRSPGSAGKASGGRRQSAASFGTATGLRGSAL